MIGVLIPAAEGGYAARDLETGTTSQGETADEAIANLREATELFYDEQGVEFNLDIIPAINSLSSDHRTMIIHRFGLFGNSQKTLDEAGDLIGLSRERARTIQNKALHTLWKRLTFPGCAKEAA